MPLGSRVQASDISLQYQELSMSEPHVGHSSEHSSYSSQPGPRPDGWPPPDFHSSGHNSVVHGAEAGLAKGVRIGLGIRAGKCSLAL